MDSCHPADHVPQAAVELTECGALDPGCPSSPFGSPLFFAFAGASLLTASSSLLLLALSLRRHEALYMITVFQGMCAAHARRPRYPLRAVLSSSPKRSACAGSSYRAPSRGTW